MQIANQNDENSWKRKKIDNHYKEVWRHPYTQFMKETFKLDYFAPNDDRSKIILQGNTTNNITIPSNIKEMWWKFLQIRIKKKNLFDKRQPLICKKWRNSFMFDEGIVDSARIVYLGINIDVKAMANSKLFQYDESWLQSKVEREIIANIYVLIRKFRQAREQYISNNIRETIKLQANQNVISWSDHDLFLQCKTRIAKIHQDLEKMLETTKYDFNKVAMYYHQLSEMEGHQLKGSAAMISEIELYKMLVYGCNPVNSKEMEKFLGQRMDDIVAVMFSEMKFRFQKFKKIFIDPLYFRTFELKKIFTKLFKLLFIWLQEPKKYQLQICRDGGNHSPRTGILGVFQEWRTEQKQDLWEHGFIVSKLEVDKQRKNMLSANIVVEQYSEEDN